MKTFWGKISKSGGAGSNPECEAIKGYVRMLTLLPTKLALRDEKRSKVIFLHFSLAPQIEFHRPITMMSNDHIKYTSILKYMFAGNIGSELERACRLFTDVDSSHVR